MNASEFIRKLKDAIHEQGYKTNELTLNMVVSHDSDCHEVYLYTKDEEQIYVVIENN
jgi:hypothetical protein